MSGGHLGSLKSLQAIDSEARWHPSCWSLVFIGGDTLSATAQSLAGFTTLRHRNHALTMVYRPMTTLPATSGADDDAGVIVVGQVVRGTRNGYYVWVVVEGNPSSLPGFFRI